MTTHLRRYVFLDFETLCNIKFRKLEKICDKAFVFVETDVENVPFSLVKDMQRMGNNIKWVEVMGSTKSDLNYHICFLMGKLHEKISADIEFAILSNDLAFDSLVNFINSTGRSCIRVKQNMPDENKVSEGNQNGKSLVEESQNRPTLVEETAKETVRRLIRSGNRPAELMLLKNYILLNNQELSAHGNVEKIIDHLEETKEIKVNHEIVEYNF